MHRSERGQHLRSKSRFTRFRCRSASQQALGLRKDYFAGAMEEVISDKINSIPTRLIASVNTFSRATPLYFQKPATTLVKSEALKQHELLAAIVLKEARYKLTAQYVESVTALIPELMNYMFSRQIEKRKVNYEAAKHVVRNIYWSLRVYLNVDPFDVRFFLKDNTPNALVRIFDNISDLAASQKTFQPQRAVLRYRFQPARLMRSRNTMRFRGD